MKYTFKKILSLIGIFAILTLIGSNLNTAAAVSLNVNLAVESSGSSPFDSGNCITGSTTITKPGEDFCSNDNIVRTHDIVTYRIDYSVNGGIASGSKIVQKLSSGAIWTELPASCLASSNISIDQRTLTCELGEISSGSIFTLKPVAKITGDSINNQNITSSVVFSAGVNIVQNSGQSTLVVSASPRYDLAQDLIYSRPIKGFANNSSGQSGIVHTYPLVIRSTKLKGNEKTNGNFDFINSLIGITPNTILFTDNGNTGCKTIEWDQYSPNLPFSQEDFNHLSPYTALNSGSVNCTQNGSNINVQITGANTTFAKKPTKTYQGLDLPADENIAVSLAISLWTPLSDLTTTELNITNSYSNLNLTPLSGTPNFGNGLEQDLVNNSSTTTLNQSAPGSFDKKLVFTTVNASADKAHDGYISPGTKYQYLLEVSNTTPSNMNEVVICDKIDRTVQKFISTPVLTYQIGGSIGDNYNVEWGQSSANSLIAIRDRNCDDNSADVDNWSTTFSAGSNIMRIKIKNLNTGVYVQFRGELESLSTFQGGNSNGLPIPNGTKLWNFGAVKFPDQNWYVAGSNCDMVTSFSVCDVVTTTKSIVRINKEALKSDGVTPTFQVLNNSDLVYKINWTVNSKSAAQSDVVITDTIPVELIYNGMYANMPAPIVTNNSNGTTTLKWSLPATPANTNLVAIKYKAKTKANLAPNISIVNEAIISSPDDTSIQLQRTSQSTIVSQILEGFQINHRVSTNQINPNQPITYYFDYQNLTSSNIDSTNFIFILPSNNYNDSYFIGTSTLDSVNTSNGEQVYYTKQTVANIDIDPDGTSNQNGGTTIWCNSLRGGNCPVNNSEVTAIKVVGGFLNSNSNIKSFGVNLNTSGNTSQDNYNSFFVGRANTLVLSVLSNFLSVNVVEPVTSSSSSSSYLGNSVASSSSSQSDSSLGDSSSSNSVSNSSSSSSSSKNSSILNQTSSSTSSLSNSSSQSSLSNSSNISSSSSSSQSSSATSSDQSSLSSSSNTSSSSITSSIASQITSASSSSSSSSVNSSSSSNSSSNSSCSILSYSSSRSDSSTPSNSSSINSNCSSSSLNSSSQSSSSSSPSSSSSSPNQNSSITSSLLPSSSSSSSSSQSSSSTSLVSSSSSLASSRASSSSFSGSASSSSSSSFSNSSSSVRSSSLSVVNSSSSIQSSLSSTSKSISSSFSSSNRRLEDVTDLTPSSKSSVSTSKSSITSSSLPKESSSSQNSKGKEKEFDIQKDDNNDKNKDQSKDKLITPTNSILSSILRQSSNSQISAIQSSSSSSKEISQSSASSVISSSSDSSISSKSKIKCDANNHQKDLGSNDTNNADIDFCKPKDQVSSSSQNQEILNKNTKDNSSTQTIAVAAAVITTVGALALSQEAVRKSLINAILKK